MKTKKKPSSLGKYVRDWRDGNKLDREDLIQFTLDHDLDPHQSLTSQELQSLVSKYVHFSNQEKKEKEQKEKKDVQEIDEVPPEEQEEQDRAHGGEEDQHQDIEDADDKDNKEASSEQSSPQTQSQNQDNSPQSQSQNQDNSPQSQSSSQSSSTPQNQGGSAQSHSQTQQQPQSTQTQSSDTSNTSNSSDLSPKEIAQKNKDHNKALNKALKELGEKYNDDSEKAEITLAQNTSRKVGYGGGGARMDDAKNPDLATFRAIQDFFLKIASEDAPIGKEDGRTKWDATKIIKSRFNADFNNAKFSRPKERNIWFIVDDSGSVSIFAEFIISMIQGASNVVNVVHGSEAKPNTLIKLPKVNAPKVLTLHGLKNYTVWEQKFSHSFLVNVKTFIKECKVQHGDILVFWGDLMDALESNIDTPEMLRRILRSYKCYWLLSHDGTERYSGNHTHVIEKSKAFKMLYEINNAKALRKAITMIK